MKITQPSLWLGEVTDDQTGQKKHTWTKPGSRFSEHVWGKKNWSNKGKNCCRLIVNEVSVMNNPLICVYCECIYLMIFLSSWCSRMNNIFEISPDIFFYSTASPPPFLFYSCCNLLLFTSGMLWLEQQNLYKLTDIFCSSLKMSVYRKAQQHKNVAFILKYICDVWYLPMNSCFLYVVHIAYLQFFHFASYFLPHVWERQIEDWIFFIFFSLEHPFQFILCVDVCVCVCGCFSSRNSRIVVALAPKRLQETNSVMKKKWRTGPTKSFIHVVQFGLWCYCIHQFDCYV